MSLSDRSRLPYSETVYLQNDADTNGGAIFVAYRISINQCRVNERNALAFCFTPNTTFLQLCRLQDDCFIELNADLPFDADSSNINMIFQNNFAGESGTVIYGGSLDNCRLYLGGGIQDTCGNLIGIDGTNTETDIGPFLDTAIQPKHSGVNCVNLYLTMITKTLRSKQILHNIVVLY